MIPQVDFWSLYTYMNIYMYTDLYIYTEEHTFIHMHSYTHTPPTIAATHRHTQINNKHSVSVYVWNYFMLIKKN